MTGLVPFRAPRYSKDEWWLDAACQGQDWVLEAQNKATINAAKRLCAECPVVQDCLREALSMEARLPQHQRYGVAGGLSRAERYKLSRAVCFDCGTKVNLGDKYCDIHKLARRRESRRRYDRSNVRSQEKAS